MTRHGHPYKARCPSALLLMLLSLIYDRQATVENLGNHFGFILDARVSESLDYLLRHRRWLIVLRIALAVLSKSLLVAGLEQLEQNVLAAWTCRLA